MTEDAALQQGIQKAVEQAGRTDATQKAREPSAEDISRFEDALNGPAGQQAVSSQPPPSKVEQNTRIEEPHTLGEAILRGLETAKESHDEQTCRVQELLDKTDGRAMSMQDVLRLQYELMQLSLQQEITTKATDKTSQGVQTLFKNQG
jgi:type III secretion system YscI/HrpB-like protein